MAKEYKGQYYARTKEYKWFIDSRCSKHMMGNISQIDNLNQIDKGFVTFGDKKKGRILGIGNIGQEEAPLIKKVCLIDGLKYNLFSISQLCDNGTKWNLKVIPAVF